MVGPSMTNIQKDKMTMHTIPHIAILGLGEAGRCFAHDLIAMGIKVSGWDPSPNRALLPANLQVAASNADAAKDADIIFSVNLSAVAEEVAKEVLPVLDASKLYCELNTASPNKKIAVSAMLQPSGVQFVDMAIMAPVPPKGIKTPFLVSGPGANALIGRLAAYSLNITYLSETVGDASTRKLLRSIVYKGIAAVICEAMEAGKAFQLEGYIREQINSVIGGNDALIDRFIEGSVTHAARRIDEMEAVSAMLLHHQIEPLLSKAAQHNLEKLLKQKLNN